MIFSWKLQRGEKVRWLLLFLTGFLTGIVLICMMQEVLVTGTGFLDASFLARIQYLDINQNGLLLYSVKERLGMAAFLVLLSAAGAAGIASWMFLAWCGLSAGAVLTALSMRYGFRGLIFFTGCSLPQQLLLIPGFLMLLDWCERKLERKKLVLPLAVVLIGCLLESYVNPLVLKVVLKIF